MYIVIDTEEVGMIVEGSEDFWGIEYSVSQYGGTRDKDDTYNIYPGGSSLW